MVNLAYVVQWLRPDAMAPALFQVGVANGSEAITYWAPSLGAQPTPEQIEAAILPATKAQRIEQDRQECRRRLTEHFGDALEQVSRAAGIGYTAQANVTEYDPRHDKN